MTLLPIDQSGGTCCHHRVTHRYFADHRLPKFGKHNIDNPLRARRSVAIGVVSHLFTLPQVPPPLKRRIKRSLISSGHISSSKFSPTSAKYSLMTSNASLRQSCLSTARSPASITIPHQNRFNITLYGQRNDTNIF